MPTPTHAPLRWGILGAGAIAGRFARDLAHTPTGTVAAVYARRPEAAAELASQHHARPTSTLETFFASGIDAVYLATHPDTHHALARAALLAGLPVLCEKPVTRSLPELDDLLALAAERNLLFMEAMKTPFLPLYRQLRDHLAADAAGITPERQDGTREPPLGPIRFLAAGNTVQTSPDHSSWSPTLAGGALLAVGVYQAFLAVDFLGPALEIQALSQPAPSVIPTEGEVPGERTCSLGWEAGAPGERTCSLGREAEKPAFASAQACSQVDAFTLVQTRHAHGGFAQLYSGLVLASPGAATLSAAGGFVTVHKPCWRPARATVTYLSGRTVELEAPILGDGLHYEAAHFADLLHAGLKDSPIVSHRHSRAVMHLLDRTRAAIALRFPGEPFPPT